jgi:hypothetical protein
MTSKILKALVHPVTLLNSLIVGFMIVVGLVHNHAHYTMEVDADSYVRAWCKKNPDTCQSYLDDY